MTPPVATSKTLPTIVEQELAKYQSTVDALHAGAIDPDKEFRPDRLVHGVYGQRQGGENQMVRIKLKYGVVTPEQMRVHGDAIRTGYVAIDAIRVFGLDRARK